MISKVLGLARICFGWDTCGKIKRSIPEKHSRKRKLHDTFIAFAAANSTGQLPHSQIKQFWLTTSDSHSFFYANSINDIRISLYDNAMLLEQLSKRIETGGVSIRQHKELTAIQEDTLEWFDIIDGQIDIAFLPKVTLLPAI